VPRIRVASQSPENGSRPCKTVDGPPDKPGNYPLQSPENGSRPCKVVTVIWIGLAILRRNPLKTGLVPARGGGGASECSSPQRVAIP
jgi:hypothetical protein